MSDQQPDNQPDQNEEENNSPTSSRSATRVFIPPSAPAGEIIITQPPQTHTSFYKIAPGEMITFAWNFTYILATPTHLTVSAVCQNGNTYPVGPTDGIIDGTATEVVWDVYSYQVNNPNTPLPQQVCNLRICDERGFGATRRAGYLSPNTGLQFALYTPQPYTPLADGWKCSVCSGAASLSAHPAAISLLVTLMICFLSGFHFLRANRAAAVAQ
ncbi:hypothetical protein CC1G_00782 [Coprinopsis cinerea okayama7|uniref:DUF7137 domain-containing protein n=1 Tax=Coprinopsis cinerea (strain Okayama-7 / 130 / ATCC MYA-4618 / FGSC 9003) TaxID=240176 RepID=A8N8Q7_COPC7|nr:hypothetical protein CC1G_00782 [Coprinopsis cinerea okayama7\|eukprot:XP_001831235.1 hypothetical protein CC1G_00782 [Coprinopsis cinerea okayama7\